MAAGMNSGSDGSPAADNWGRRGFIGAVAATAAAAVVAAPAPASASALSPLSGPSAPPAGRTPRRTRQLFLGTYTTRAGGGTGLGLASYDETSGRITGTGTLTGVPDPSYLCLHPSGKTLYAVNEREQGGVTAIALSAAGPEVLGTRATGGAGPCHLSVHPGGRWLLSANYGSGSVAVHPVESSGALGELSDLATHSSPPPGPGQDGPHAHQIVTSPDGGHVLAVDLGNDTVYSYRLDTKQGKLSQVSYAALRAGAGPRHLTFHPSGRFAYLANELDNTVVVCAYDPASGRLTPGEPQSTGTGEGTSYPAQLLVTREGTFAFLANRGHNSLTRYAVEADGARLRLLDTVPAGGDFPRHIAFSPSQQLLFAANQKSDSVSVFTVGGDGRLSPAGEPFAAPVPVCALPV
ncbi:lactonase family protein [Streptomyces sp. NPDC059900]|uniref:lactonase family protein n=1 Tax=Streptomyces sp. NPDC059900 TaxID=3155816 RepID=UPI00341F9342